MLRRHPTNAEIEETIHRTIVDLLERSGKAVQPFDDEDLLVSTGLSSLDLAALVARLERTWSVDPFLEAVPITEVRTVRDLCRVYRECLKKASRPPSASDAVGQ